MCSEVSESRGIMGDSFLSGWIIQRHESGIKNGRNVGEAVIRKKESQFFFATNTGYQITVVLEKICGMIKSG